MYLIVVPDRCVGLTSHDMITQNDICLRLTYDNISHTTKTIKDVNNPVFDSSDVRIFPIQNDDCGDLVVDILEVDSFSPTHVVASYVIPISISEIGTNLTSCDQSHVHLSIGVVECVPTLNWIALRKQHDDLNKKIKSLTETIKAIQSIVDTELDDSH